MKITRIMAMVVAAGAGCATAATNSSLTDEELLQIGFKPAINHRISPGLTFRDEGGQPVRLGDYFGKKPGVLMLGYYGCPMLCTLVLNGAMESFRNLKWRAGEDFDVIFVSINPAETPGLAAEKKRAYLRGYGSGATGSGWHFLTGGTTAIQQLADEVGFKFAYDPVLKEYAHPSGFVVLTPEGRISRYFCGVTFSASEVDRALREAADSRTAPAGNQFSLVCFHYSPPTGRYGRLVIWGVRGSGALAVILLGLLVLRPWRPRKLEQAG